MSHAFTKADEAFMAMALEEARQAGADGDVPVGAVLIKTSTGEVISRGRNTREVMRSALGHAEMNTISEACAALNSWRLVDCTLYVTLEPCPMCAGGIINARIEAVRYGARDEKAGCCASVLNLFEERFNHKPRLYGGLLEGECAGQLQEFFEKLR